MRVTSATELAALHRVWVPGMNSGKCQTGDGPMIDRLTTVYSRLGESSTFTMRMKTMLRLLQFSGDEIPASAKSDIQNVFVVSTPKRFHAWNRSSGILKVPRIYRLLKPTDNLVCATHQ